MKKIIKPLGGTVTAILFGMLGLTQPAHAALDQDCVVNILNRTIQVSAEGTWAMPNVPSNMGQVRARATCVQNGQTISGQSDYFNVLRNGISNVSEIQFAEIEPVPTNIAFIPAEATVVNGIDTTIQLAVTATYPDASTVDVSSSLSGINYSSSNPAIATIDEEGLVTGLTAGSVLITARKDGAVALKRITVVTTGDTDSDGLPDDFELENGLNPNDAIDAQEDIDEDGLTALEEFELGTDLNNADSDSDGINDGEEVIAGVDGFITNPLNADSDSDGLSDSIEVAVGSSPIDGADANISAALVSISVTPEFPAITFNTIYAEASRQLTVMGQLIDGSQIDITSSVIGTTYSSSDLNVASFGLQDGQIFAGQEGTADIVISNNGFQTTAYVTVERFEPAALSYVSIPGYANNVDVVGRYAYVAAGSAGLQVVDVSIPESPVVVASLDTPGTSIDVKVVGELLYLADGAAGMQVIDISDPLNPMLISTTDTTGVAQDIIIDGTYAYIADGNSGLHVIDVTDPILPIVVGSLEGLGLARGVDVTGDTAVVVADTSLHVVDLLERSAPVLSSSINIGSVKDVVVKENYAYVVAYSTGYRVVDITDPTTPFITGGTREIVPRDVVLDDSGMAFYAEQLFPNVIAYVNVADPTSPVFQGTIDLSRLGDYAGTGIDIQNGYVYVTEENYVVRSDYGSSGNTRLFIARYRFLEDLGTTPPDMTLVSPDASMELTQGQDVLMEVEATDDVYVSAVQFLIDDEIVATVSSEPYQYTYHVPETADTIRVSARAVDLAGNVSTSPVTLFNVIPNQPSIINILEPVAGAEIIEGANFAFSVDATDSLGISRVDFVVNGEVLGNDTTAPYSCSCTLPTTVAPGIDIPVTVNVVDTIGAVTTSDLVLITILDDPAPQVSLDSPIVSDTLVPGTDLTLRASAIDNVRVSRIEFYVEGQRISTYNTYGENVTASRNYFINASDETRGNIRVFVRAIDNLGQSIDSPEITLAVAANGLPSAGITGPLEGDTVAASGRVTLTADATDDGGVNYVNFYVDGAYVGRDSSVPYQYTYVVANAKGDTGSMQVTARVYDRLNVFTESTPVTLNVTPNQNPVVTLTGPTVPLTLPAGAYVNIGADANDLDQNGSITRVRFYVNGSERTSDTGSPYARDVLLEDADVGETSIFARAFDLNGNMTETAPVAITVLPNQPPAINMTAPTTGTQVIQGQRLTITADATDDGGVNAVRLYVNGVYRTWDTSSPYSFSYYPSAIDAAAGTVTVSVQAQDRLNVRTMSESVAVTVVPDLPPTANITSPVVGSRLAAGVQNSFQVEATDDIGINRVYFYVDGNYVGYDSTAPYVFNYTPTPVQAETGTISVYARSRDTLNQYTYSETLSYAVDPNQPPESTLLAPVTGAEYVVNAPITLQASATDDTRVDRVEFYANDILVSTDYYSPYSVNHTPGVVGDLRLVARAVDNLNQITDSTVVVVNIIEDQPPTISITSPIDGSRVIEGSRLTVVANAADDVAVDRVDIVVSDINGATVFNLTSPPYTARIEVPAVAQATDLTITAHAFDSIGQFTDSAPVSVGIDADPLTSVAGRVVDADGLPIEGSTVRVNIGDVAPITTLADGLFTATGLPTVKGDIVVTATANISGVVLYGASNPMVPMPGGQVNVGDIALLNAPLLDQEVVDGDQAQHVEAAVDTSSNIHMIWLDQVGVGEQLFGEGGSYYAQYRSSVFYQMLDGAGQVVIAPTRITGDDLDVGSITMFLSENQTIQLAGAGRSCDVNGCTAGVSEVWHMTIDAGLDDQNSDAADLAAITAVPRHVVSTDDGMTSDRVDMVLDTEANIHLAWRDRTVAVDFVSEDYVRYTKLNGQNGAVMTPEVNVAQAGTGSDWRSEGMRAAPTITVDSNGHAHLVWGAVNAVDGQLVYAMIDGANGSIRISATNLDQTAYMRFTQHSLAVDSVGRLSIFSARADNCGECSTTDYELIYRRIDPSVHLQDGSVGDPILLEDLQPVTLFASRTLESPSLSKMLASGDVHVAWGNGGSIYYQRIDSVAGTMVYASPLRLGTSSNNTATGGYYPARGVELTSNTASGQVLVLWSDGGDIHLRGIAPDAPTASVTGRLLLPSSVPAANSVVSIVNDAGQWDTVTDAQGQFLVDGIDTILSTAGTMRAFLSTEAENWAVVQTVELQPGVSLALQDITMQVVEVVYETDLGVGLFQSDDDWNYITFNDGFTFPFFGATYSGLYVSSNGRITFQSGSTDYSESTGDFSQQPQIATFYDDLDPSWGGDVYVNQLLDRVVITWYQIPHYSNGGAHTVQAVLYPDGRVQLVYNGITSTASGTIVGVSPGPHTIPQESDLSLGVASSIGEVALYQYFGGGDPFDLDQQFVIFTPNAGAGFDVQTAPLIGVAPVLPDPNLPSSNGGEG